LAAKRATRSAARGASRSASATQLPYDAWRRAPSDYPTRVDIVLQRKRGQVALDQIRTVDKFRLVRRFARLPEPRAREVADVLVRMFVYG
jgi:mRNA-degrading endonuclease toxin of MazEF toxin-antitoxin module